MASSWPWSYLGRQRRNWRRSLYRRASGLSWLLAGDDRWFFGENIREYG
jgi:hypothetical protein